MDIYSLLNKPDVENRDVIVPNGTNGIKGSDIPVVSHMKSLGLYTPESSASPLSSASSTPRLSKRHLKRESIERQSHPYARPLCDSDTNSEGRDPYKNPRKNVREQQNRADLTARIGQIEKILLGQNPNLPGSCGWKTLAKHNSVNKNIPEQDQIQHNKIHVLTTAGDFIEQNQMIIQYFIQVFYKLHRESDARYLEELCAARGTPEFKSLYDSGRMQQARL